MMAFVRSLSLLMVGLFTLALSACGGSGSSGPVFEQLEITPQAATVTQGQTRQLTATAVFSDGTRRNVSSDARWTSGNAAAAQVSNTGLVSVNASAPADAQVSITATYLGKTATAAITVKSSAPTVASIAVTPARSSLEVGATTQLTATATMSDGQTVDITQQAEWKVGDESIATVSSSGLVTGVKARPVLAVVVTATFEGKSAIARVTVTAADAGEEQPAVMTGLRISPAAAEVIEGGQAIELKALATFSDDTTIDVTAEAEWTVSGDQADAVELGNSAADKGRVSGKQVTEAGKTAKITATLEDLTASANVTVKPALLERVEVSPASVRVPKNFTQPLSATAHYSNGTSKDVTDLATWSAVGTAVSVSSKGLVTANTAGTDAVAVKADFQGLTGMSGVTVTNATLESIEVSPKTLQIAQGLTQQFSATGVFSDDSTRDVTTNVTWSTDAAATADFDPAESGLLTALAASPTPVNVIATNSGETGTATVIVTDVTLSKIEISGAEELPKAGYRVALKATGTFTDDTEQDLTQQVEWRSSDSAVAAVQTSAGSNSGVVTTAAAGVSNITAKLGTVTSSAFAFESLDATLTSIQIKSDSLEGRKAEMSFASDRTFKADGTFSLGEKTRTFDISKDVTWSVEKAKETDADPSTVATADNAAAKGKITTLVCAAPCADKTVQVKASKGGVSDSIELKVTDSALTAITVTFAQDSAITNLPKDFKRQLKAIGTYASGPARDITENVTWSVANVGGSETDAAFASVSNDAASKGLATGNATGSVKFTAKLLGISGDLAAAVTNATLVSIAVPTSPTITQGSTTSLVANGTFSGGDVLDISRFNGIAWSSSDIAKVTVGVDNGQAKGVGQGSATITATRGAIAPATATVTVSGHRLTAVRVLPKTDTACGLAANDDPEQLANVFGRALMACADFDGDASRDVTSQATWTTSDAVVVAVTGSGADRGFVTAVAPFDEDADQSADIEVSYTEDGVTQKGRKAVELVDFTVAVTEVARNPAGAAGSVVPADGGTVDFKAHVKYDGMRKADASNNFDAVKGFDVSLDVPAVTWTLVNASGAMNDAAFATTGVQRVTVDAAAPGDPADTGTLTAGFAGKTSNTVTITRAAAAP